MVIAFIGVGANFLVVAGAVDAVVVTRGVINPTACAVLWEGQKTEAPARGILLEGDLFLLG